MANTYDFGDRPRISGTVTSSGSEVDPSGVVFKLLKPSGTEVTYTYETDAELVRSDTGDYYVDYTVDEAGRWEYRFESSGDYIGAGVGFFYVNPEYGP